MVRHVGSMPYSVKIILATAASMQMELVVERISLWGTAKDLFKASDLKGLQVSDK